MRNDGNHVEAFQAYVDLGAGRSLKKLQELLSSEGEQVSLRTLENWSRKHDWRAKLVSIETSALRKYATNKSDELSDAIERTTTYGLLLQKLGIERLTGLDGDDITPALALKLLDRGIEYESRISKSQSTPTFSYGASDGGFEQYSAKDILEDKLMKIVERSGPHCGFECENCVTERKKWDVEHGFPVDPEPQD